MSDPSGSSSWPPQRSQPGQDGSSLTPATSFQSSFSSFNLRQAPHRTAMHQSTSTTSQFNMASTSNLFDGSMNSASMDPAGMESTPSIAFPSTCTPPFPGGANPGASSGSAGGGSSGAPPTPWTSPGSISASPARRPSIAGGLSSTAQGSVPISNPHFRKNSTLGSCEPIYARASGPNSPSPSDESVFADDDDDNGAAVLGGMESDLDTAGGGMRHPQSSSRGDDSPADSPMMIGSPSLNAIRETSTEDSIPNFNRPNFQRANAPTGSPHVRSRTPPLPSSVKHIPPSPAAIAKALSGQTERKTPPPFLQRRLFGEDLNQMIIEGSRGSSSDGEASMPGVTNEMKLPTGPSNELNLIFKPHDSRSGSGSGEEGNTARAGVVRRAVSRKPNLLPKSKSHLRVLSELRSETGPADLAEVLSEAALHRLSRSGASPIAGSRSSISSLNASSFPLPSTESATSTGGLANRFPEQIDDVDGAPSPPSSDGDDLALDEAGSDWGGTMSLGGYETEGEESEQRAKANLWTGFRNGNSNNPVTSAHSASSGSNNGGGLGGAALVTTHSGKSPGSGGLGEKKSMEMEAPQTPNWQSSARPGKRKLNDDRFEPYAIAFKRRAVSPAALSLSPSVASPLLSFTSSTTGLPGSTSSSHISISTPPALASSSATFPAGSLPISIPSPTLGPTHMSYFGTRSRAASPVPSSLSSSAGRGAGTGTAAGGFLSFVGRLEREERNGGEKMGDEIGRMSLG
ncbi:BZ3500_MvSof-1268-A1-R1_Chr1-1g00868 [Microbotryum saponariae]|uniref:BZ3500_MvSof-1268-A1-R1_Chr1-1g00868 protein n=1 Tax=Microbotryum saponariae TaxID=289078 RepID=A0A2X0LAK4_9BASI|nr:BZ3500_MvSof-1268-A1-R1_Chr1-1g00868 [Microbotryum saponariae]SCZ92813.1 BZ3501_MvSof-1269-A2-R1_Chr1-1g00465 [Microbotryum saponariae]